MIITEENLTYHLVRRPELKDSQIKRMYDLMAENYDYVHYDIFSKDLSKKDYVGVISTSDGNIQGFTTYAVNPHDIKIEDSNIIFSGDTIINPKFWGTQILMKAWCYTIGLLMSKDLEANWYWYLLSKGHKTYMYLPLFFKDYHPSIDANDNNKKLFEIADTVSKKMYGNSWKPEEGIIRFPHKMGQLNKKHIEETYKKKNSSIVNSFLQKNPGFHQGDELVCIAPLKVENMKRSAKTYMIHGLKQEFGE